MSITERRRPALAAALLVATAGLVALPAQSPASAHPGGDHRHHHHGCVITATDGFAEPIPALHCRSLAQYLAAHMADRLPESVV